jgi:predicted porin
LTAGGGAAFEGHVEQEAANPDRDEQEFYQAGLNLTFGNFAVGGVFQYYNDLAEQGDDTSIDNWVAGAGIAYSMDAWTIGAQYSHGDSENDGDDGGESTQDRIVLTGNYAMGPGINIDAEIGYTWVDVDQNGDSSFGQDEADDGYDALEIGIGTNITF